VPPHLSEELKARFYTVCRLLAQARRKATRRSARATAAAAAAPTPSPAGGEEDDEAMDDDDDDDYDGAGDEEEAEARFERRREAATARAAAVEGEEALPAASNYRYDLGLTTLFPLCERKAKKAHRITLSFMLRPQLGF